MKEKWGRRNDLPQLPQALIAWNHLPHLLQERKMNIAKYILATPNSAQPIRAKIPPNKRREEILEYLKKHGETSSKNISIDMKVNLATLAASLNTLEDYGLVTSRVVSNSDCGRTKYWKAVKDDA